MMKSVLIICLAVAVFILLIIAMAKRKHSRYSDLFFYSSVVIAAVGGFIFYGCGFAELKGNLFLAVVSTVFATLKMFLISNDYASIKDAAILQNDNMVLLFWVLHLLALYSTANAILTTLGMPIVMKMRAWDSKRKKNLVILYGINADSLTLGRDLLEDKKKSLLYIDEDADSAYVNEIIEMGAFYYLGSRAVGSECSFLKSMGVKKNKSLMVYAMSSEEEKNYAYALSLVNRLESMEIPKERTTLTLMANMELPYGRALQAYDGKYGYGSVLVIDRAYLVARSLVKQHPPCNYVAFDEQTAKAKEREVFRAVVVGFGSIGQAILKNLVINGQFENAGFHVAVFDPAYQTKAGYIFRNCQGMLENYDITFYDKGGQTVEFYQYIEEHVDTVNYFVVCTGNQKYNNEIAIGIENTVIHYGGKAKVFRCSYEGILEQYVDEHGSLINRTIDLYTADNLDIMKFDKCARKLNHIYRKGTSEEEDWKLAGYMDRMSCRASADFALSFMKMAGCTEEDVLQKGAWGRLTEVQMENLARTEHLRWCAFHYSMGYQRMPKEIFERRSQAYLEEKQKNGISKIRIQKDVSRRLHTCLVDWDELDEKSAEYRDITGDSAKDYKKDDCNNVMMLPELLQ